MDLLPSEILHRIFEPFECTIPFDNWQQGYLDEIECPPPRELITLSKVCRRFRDIARPIIYRTLAFQSREDDHPKAAEAFSRTLCADLSIGQGIRHLHMDHWCSIDDEGKASELLAKAEHLDERQERWLRRWLAAEIDWSDEDKILVLLILTPRLRMLDCDTIVRGALPAYLSGRQDVEDYFFENVSTYGWPIDAEEHHEQDEDENEAESGIAYSDEDDPAQNTSQKTAISPEYPFAELTELRFRYDMLDSYESVSDIECVLLHPALEILRLFAFTWTQRDVKKMRWNRFPSNLRSLQLKDAIVDATGLKDILRRCKQLRSLHIVLTTSSRGFDTEEDREGVDLDEMGAVLRRHGQQIESFDFRTEAYRAYFKLEGHLGPGLKGLKALRQLKISVEDLGEFGRDHDEGLGLATALRDLLPETLESIYILPSEGDVCPGVPRTLLMSEAFAALRKVEVEAYDISDPENLVVPGWIKSERIDLINRHQSEELMADERSIVIFSRDE